MSPQKDPLAEVARQVRNWFCRETLEEAIFRIESGGNRPSRVYLVTSSRYGNLLRISVTQNGHGPYCEVRECYFGKLPESNRIKDLKNRLLAHVDKQNEEHWYLGGEANDNPPTI